jgi:hypothetical protein
MAIPLGICCPMMCTSLIRFVNGRSKAARIKETTKYSEIEEKYHPKTRKVIKKRIR